MTLLVVVDATPYGPVPSGARRRAEALLPRLARARPDAVFEVHWARDGGGPGPACTGDRLVHATDDVSCRGGAWRLWRRARALRRRHREAPYGHLLVDHGPVVVPDRVRAVVTVHDLRFLHGYGGRLRALYGRARYGAVLRRAAVVVAVSDAVRDELSSAYGLRDVVVARNAVEAPFSPAARADAAAVAARLGARAPYVLVVGRDEPRKALRAAVAAWREARARAPDLGLVLAGAAGLAVEDAVVLPSPGDGDLAALYAGAAWTMVPSRYEGFSLPVAESLACGTPVVASDVAAHRALVADGATGAVLVPPPATDAADAWPGAADALLGARPALVAPPRSTWDDAATAVAAAL